MQAWRRRPGVGRVKGADVDARTDFVELLLAPPVAAPDMVCELQLTDGTTLRVPRGFDAGELSRILELLAARF